MDDDERLPRAESQQQAHECSTTEERQRVLPEDEEEVSIEGEAQTNYREPSIIEDPEEGSTSTEEEESIASSAIREADCEFVELADRIGKFCRIQEALGEHFGTPQRNKFSVVTEYVLSAMACAAVIAATAIVLGRNVDALRRRLPKIFDTPTIQGIVLTTLLVAIALGIIAGVGLIVLRNAERERKSKLLHWLLEDAMHRVNTMSGIDKRVLSVYTNIQRVQHDLDRRVSFLENREYEQDSAINDVEDMQRYYRERMGMLDASFAKHLTQFNQHVRDIAGQLERLLQATVDETKSTVGALEERINSNELGYKRSHEEVMKRSSTHLDMIRNALSDALEKINAGCEAMQTHAAHTNSNVEAILRSNLSDAKTLMEDVIKRRCENMETISYMLSNRHAAAAAACITLYDMCENMKKVKNYHVAHKYDGIKKKLAYSGSPSVALMDFFNAHLVNETIVILYDNLATELRSISSVVPELKEAMSTRTYLEQHGEKCRNVIANCCKKLLGSSGILNKKKYSAMKTKLATIMTLQFPEAPETDEAINAIKACVPSLMVFSHVLQIAENIAQMHESSQDMYEGFSSVQCNLEQVSAFLQTQQTVGSNIELTAEVEPVRGDTEREATQEI
ncbi:hypothetical protein [Anaplasma bovis]|uniref:hypothetical protein n=1 Tax=Anaplasma bovis TaxID=186733 RepID=UPI002FEF3E12